MEPANNMGAQITNKESKEAGEPEVDCLITLHWEEVWVAAFGLVPMNALNHAIYVVQRSGRAGSVPSLVHVLSSRVASHHRCFGVVVASSIFFGK